MPEPEEIELAMACAREVAAHERPLTLVLGPLTGLRLVGLLQLALRHPDVDEGNRLAAATIIEHVRGYFADAPAVLEVFRRGDDPGQDR